ncbi:hypothetical protein ACJZ2D_011492 [Fusarium nematophilum]
MHALRPAPQPPADVTRFRLAMPETQPYLFFYLHTAIFQYRVISAAQLPANHVVSNITFISSLTALATEAMAPSSCSQPAWPLYTDLEIHGRQFRLLEIVSAEPSIVCKLEVSELGKDQHFHALSYVWGDPEQTDTVSVNGNSIQVTRNLADALRHAPGHLKPTGGSIRIWADAICINQRDDNEKKHQVPLMKDIYSLADIVICWLGPYNEDVFKAMDCIEVIARERCSRGSDGSGDEVEVKLRDVARTLRPEVARFSRVVNQAWEELDTSENVDPRKLIELFARVQDASPTGSIRSVVACISDILDDPGRIIPNHRAWTTHLKSSGILAMASLSTWKKFENGIFEAAPAPNGPEDAVEEFRVGFTKLLEHGFFGRKLKESVSDLRAHVTWLEEEVIYVGSTLNLEWLKQHRLIYEPVEDLNFHESGLSSMVDMLLLPYWKRVWIFQEIVLGTQPMFACGNRSISWASLESVLSWAEWFASTRPEQRPDFIPHRTWSLLNGLLVEGFSHLRHVAQARASIRNLRRMDATAGVRVPDDRAAGAARDCWGNSCTLTATDPRDHFYGFLGLSPLDLVPDYGPTKSVGQVCADFMVAYIDEYRRDFGPNNKTGGELQPLQQAGIGNGWFFFPGTPSWAPNYPGLALVRNDSRIRFGTPIFVHHRTLLGHELFGEFPKAEVMGSRMLVPAIKLDKITSVGPLRHEYANLTSDSTSEHVVAWALDFAMSREKYVTGSQPLEALYGALLYDAVWEFEQKEESVYQKVPFQGYASLAHVLIASSSRKDGPGYSNDRRLWAEGASYLRKVLNGKNVRASPSLESKAARNPENSLLTLS